MAIDVVGYPAPRFQRDGPAIITPVGVAESSSGIPTTRTFWVVNSTAATSRTSSSTPRIKGPALLRRWVARANNAANPPTMFFEVGVAPAPISEVNVALTVPKPFRTIHERMEPAPVTVNANLSGFPSSTLIGSTDHAQFDVDALILDADFVLVLSNENAAAVAVDWVGYFTVVENLSRDALANFL